MDSVFHRLPAEDLAKIMSLGREVTIQANEKIFSEGDEADNVYYLKSGKVAIYIDKFNTRDQLRLVGDGDWFGEMAMFNAQRRNANAVTLEDTVFLSVPRPDFTRLMEAEHGLRQIIVESVNRRNLDLVLKEKLIDIEGLREKDFHISIKGDPSLRESAMQRERYQSIVDLHMPELVKCIEDLLLNRVVHRVTIGFNNGEVRISSLLDPFCEEFHPAIRLLDESYVERHFPPIDYEQKAAHIRRIYRSMQESGLLAILPGHIHQGIDQYFDHWHPISREKISHAVSQLTVLRSIPNFYVRNVTLGILKDAIHMQFNCDGTHIVSASGYRRFIAENL